MDFIQRKSLVQNDAGVAKLADAPDLGSGGAILRGSSPLPGIFSETLMNTRRDAFSGDDRWPTRNAWHVGPIAAWDEKGGAFTGPRTLFFWSEKPTARKRQGKWIKIILFGRSPSIC